MTSRLVSVVTVTRNMGDRLPACVASVAAQSYEPIEHIIVDGASTDGTIDFLRTLATVRWLSEPDDGQTDALTKGFRLAQGDVLTWLNADDALLPDAIERAMAALHDRSIGLAYGDVEFVEDGIARVVRPPTAVTAETLARGNRLLQPGTLFTRSAFEAAGGLDLSFSLAMDFDLWLRMLETGTKAVYVPGVLARFEIHSRSKTGRERGIAFAAEEARALLRVQQVAGAAASIRSWTRQDAMNDVLTALESGDRTRARRLATEAARSYDPVMNRGRLFLWLARIAPRIARAVSRTARR